MGFITEWLAAGLAFNPHLSHPLLLFLLAPFSPLSLCWPLHALSLSPLPCPYRVLCVFCGFLSSVTPQGCALSAVHSHPGLRSPVRGLCLFSPFTFNSAMVTWIQLAFLYSYYLQCVWRLKQQIQFQIPFHLPCRFPHLSHDIYTLGMLHRDVQGPPLVFSCYSAWSQGMHLNWSLPPSSLLKVSPYSWGHRHSCELLHLNF